VTRDSKSGATTPAAQLAAFLARFSPDVRAVAKAARATIRGRYPGAVEFVYDNYNALVIGFGPNERPSEAWFSIALYPRYVTLYLLQGAFLDDPDHLLQGMGKQVRSIRLEPDASVLERPSVRALLDAAIEEGGVSWNRRQPRQIQIRWISKKQRPRRP
jgi:hypothetical protein